MNKFLIAGVACLFPTLSFAATIPSVVVVNQEITGTVIKKTVYQIPLGQGITLSRAAPGASLLQDHDDNGQVTQSTAAVVKPLFVEHISTMKGDHGAIVTITYTYNYKLGVAQTDVTNNQTTIVQKENTYSRSVTKDVPYGQVATVRMALPPVQPGYDKVLHDLFPATMVLTISSGK